MRASSGHRGDGSGLRPSRRLATVTFVFLLFVPICSAAAQNISQDLSQSVTPEQLRQLFSALPSPDGATQVPGSTVPTSTVLEPITSPAPALPRSRLEEILSVRSGIALSQFGYEELGVSRAAVLPQMGAVQDDYVLGPGDEVIVTLRGQENARYRTQVDRDGRVTLPRLEPLAAAGRSFGEFREELAAAIHRGYVSTESSVSLGQLRQISVLVSGEVGSPGVRILTGLSAPIDAILLSGGVKKSGSLRDIRVTHQGRTYSLDLYCYLTSGIAARRIPLSDGDRIFVPPLTKVVAAAGWVRRPGIFEMTPGQSAVTVKALAELAGGLEVGGRYRFEVLRMEQDGQTRLSAVAAETALLGDGDILLVLPAADQVVDRAVLAGGTSLSGSYPIKDGTRVSDLLKQPGALGTSPYTVFGIISRRDPRTYLRSLIAFSPVAALSGENDPRLESGDIVRIFSMRESRLLSRSLATFDHAKEYSEEVTRNPFSASPMPPMSSDQPSAGRTQDRQDPDEPIQSAIAQAAAFGIPGSDSVPPSRSSLPNSPADLDIHLPNNPADSRFPTPGTQSSAAPFPETADAAASQPPPAVEPAQAPNFLQEVAPPGGAPSNVEATDVKDIASQLAVDHVVLVNFLEDHEVTLDGAVRGPGIYVVGPAVNLHDLVMVAGGTVGWADKSGVELISTAVNDVTGAATTSRRTLPLDETTLARCEVEPHDEFRFREVFTAIGLGAVTLEGEVRFPGRYEIIRGERLMDLLKRAGGLTDVAYPYGTIFLRRSAAALEEESFRRTADLVEDQLLLAISRNGSNAKMDGTAFAAAQGLVQSLRAQKGLGRISVTADPSILAARPDENPLLEANDLIYVPQRPATVSVLGEVLQPGTFTYRSGFSARDYLAKAGGYSAFADDALAYIVLPDGSAEKLDHPWLPFGSQPVPPGSAIVVPRDIAPLQWSDILTNASQIFSQLAVAGASLAVISSNIR